MAAITKREIFLNGTLLHTISAPPFDKYVHPPLAIGTHTLMIKTYVDGVLAHESPVRTIFVPGPTPTEGVVSDYDFTSISGNLIDIIGAHNGTLFGGITRSGVDFDFDGTTGYIEIPDNDDHSFTDVNGDLPFTIRMVVTLKNLTGRQWIISRRKDTATGQEYQIALFDGSLMFSLIDSTGTMMQLNYATTGLAINTKYHLVCKYDGSKTRGGMKMYLNGVLLSPTIGGSSTYAGMPNTTSKTLIGRGEFNSSFFANFKIEKLRIHKGYEWTAENITKDYNALMV